MLTIVVLVVFSLIAVILIAAGFLYEMFASASEGGGFMFVGFGAVIAIVMIVLGICLPLGQLNYAKGYPYSLESWNQSIQDVEQLLSRHENTKELGSGIASAAEGVELKQRLTNLYIGKNNLVQEIRRRMNGDDLWWIGYKIKMPADFAAH